MYGNYIKARLSKLTWHFLDVSITTDLRLLAALAIYTKISDTNEYVLENINQLMVRILEPF